MESFDWLFTKAPRAKEFNDKDNKKREEILGILLSPNSLERNSLTVDSPDSNYWKSVRMKLVEKIAPLLAENGASVNSEQIFAISKGGRGQNYDLLAFLGKLGNEESGLKLEFKRGASIYDHPQILSMYARAGFLITATTQTYPEFFYENFIEKVERLIGATKPNKRDYLAKVFGSSPSAHPFFESGYRFAKTGGAEQLQDIADDSIAQYFAYLARKVDFLDLAEIQEKLNIQSEKTFLSWDYKTQSFNTETIPLGSLSLRPAPRYKASRKGKVHTLVLDTKSGAEVHALLRWKNHPCVQGPAFQIRVTSI
jgi:hypothetical protein